MALLEKLEPGNVYLVKISASNQAGDGPFSVTVELPVLSRKSQPGKSPRHTYSQTKTIGTKRQVSISPSAFINAMFCPYSSRLMGFVMSRPVILFPRRCLSFG